MKRTALIAVLVLAACAKKKSTEDNVNDAKLATSMFAREAYPQWQREHADKSCPDSIEQLVQYMDSKNSKDPWGNGYKLVCGPNAPAGVRGVGVFSFGIDGKEGTADDIKSWE